MRAASPLAILRNWLPLGLSPITTADMEAGGLYAQLRAVGVRICVASQRIGARSATAEEARLLATRRGAPLLTMERVTYDDRGRAVEFGNPVYRSDSYSFEATLVEASVASAGRRARHVHAVSVDGIHAQAWPCTVPQRARCGTERARGLTTRR